MTTMRIADVAARSGFSTATLRYYEDIGLLPASRRERNGYRAYDESVLDRLAFVARAKQLGCTLEEISDLLVAWDGGECGPVRERLRELVAGKLSETRAQIVELMTLTSELELAAAALDRHRSVGPCDDRCACMTDSAPMTTGRSVPITLVDRRGGDGPAIACTLEVAEMPDRLARWGEIVRRVTSRELIDGGVRVGLNPPDVAAAAALAAAEQDCCSFFAFALTIDARGSALEVRAPADAEPLVRALVGAQYGR